MTSKQIVVETNSGSKYFYLNSICQDDTIYHVLAGVHTGAITALPETVNLKIMGQCLDDMRADYLW